MVNKNSILRKIAGIICIILWSGIIVKFTILGRTKYEESHMVLELFWCLEEAWIYKNPLDWYYLIGNVVLFVPLGFIITAFFQQFRTWWKVTICGFSASITIEVIQYVARIGLFELDDIFNNTLGTYLGFCLCVIAVYIFRIESREKLKKSLVLSIISLLLIVTFLTIAIICGQPVFDIFDIINIS